jgi:hypothetical protein
MKTTRGRSPRWSTSAFGSSPNASPKEIASLGAHLAECRAKRGAFFNARSVADTIDRFAAPRTVTIFALSTLLSALAGLLV